MQWQRLCRHVDRPATTAEKIVFIILLVSLVAANELIDLALGQVRP